MQAAKSMPSLSICSKKNAQRFSNTPYKQRVRNNGCNDYTRDAAAEHSHGLAIPPFVFIKSYYWPCKNFNARGCNLLKPTGMCSRHYMQNNLSPFFFSAARSTFAREIMFSLENYFADTARTRFHDSANYDHYGNIVVQRGIPSNNSAWLRVLTCPFCPDTR